MRLLPCGERALLIEVASLDEVLALETSLRGLAEAGRGAWGEVVDVVPAARTVLVTGPPADLLRRLVEAALGSAEPSSVASPPVREVVIPVRYDGPDLEDVAALTGLTVDQVVAAHTGTPWRVAFGGFAPGFAYLVGGDPRLRVPRRGSPRTRVPAGSVGLADEFSGVYPTASPGGWQVIGESDVALFDPSARPPALLTPGTRVRFEATDAPPTAISSAVPAAQTTSARALLVEETLLPILIEDEGRPGLAAIGVGASGAADLGAYRLGARLVGNRDGEAALELAMGRADLIAVGDLTLALTGSPCLVTVDGRAVSAGIAFTAPDGARIRIGAPADGLRSYLSVRGGIDVPEVLGSRSRDTLGSLGPEPVQAGARLPVAEAKGPWLPGIDWTPLSVEPVDLVELRYLPGPRDDWVEGMDGSEWVVGSAVDRIGARLTGEPLRRREGELPSEPVVRGAIQVPPSGEPVLFLADHPVTGGYPVAGVLTAQAADRAAQLRPGQRCRLVAVRLRAPTAG